MNALAIFWRKLLGKRPLTEAQLTGAKGERLALRWLEQHTAFRLLVKNIHIGGGELDLVGWDGDVLVFIEVRTRKSNALVAGSQTLTKSKRRALKKACKAYLKQVRHDVQHYRFDVVQVSVDDDGKSEVSHFANVRLFS